MIINLPNKSTERMNFREYAEHCDKLKERLKQILNSECFIGLTVKIDTDANSIDVDGQLDCISE